jgi:hypothetical protein
MSIVILPKGEKMSSSRILTRLFLHFYTRKPLGTDYAEHSLDLVMKPLNIEAFILTEHFAALKDADAKFILEHGEKQLKDTLDTSGLIIGRLSSIVSVVVTFMVALVSYGLTRGVDKGFGDRNVITAFVGAGYLYLPAILIVWNFLSQKYYHLGSEPKDFFVDKIFKDNKDNELKAIYCYEIRELQARIKHNKMKNNRRWLRFNIALILVLLTPVVLYIAYCVIPQ